MGKNKQKWIASLVVCTFVWLLQASAMPVAAAGTIEKFSSAGAEQGPEYLEAAGQKADPAKKKSILPYIFIGVGVLAVTAAVLFLFVPNTYDITGTWNFTFTYGVTNSTFAIMFAGDKKSGSFSCSANPNLSGTFAVDGKKVNLILTVQPDISFSGQFTDKNTMNGTLTQGAVTQTWSARRE